LAAVKICEGVFVEMPLLEEEALEPAEPELLPQPPRNAARSRSAVTAVRGSRRRLKMRRC
jgi:hypothetical protein